jgi:hypothetical protein
MTRVRSRAALAVALCAGLLGVSGAQRILVGPDAPVSADGSASHMELMLAANPRDSRSLIGASIVETGPPNGTETHIYVSDDGGGTWTTHTIPEVARLGGGDPQVWFSADGTGYFATLSTITGAKGAFASALLVSRSADGGATWSKAFRMPGPSYDHEQAISDFYSRRFKGRTYLAALYGFPDYSIAVWHSSNAGRTWSPRVLAMKMHRYGINVVTPVVLADGTLYVFTVDFPIWRTQQAAWSNLWEARSTDGGVHFSNKQRIGRVHNLTLAQDERGREAGDFVEGTFPAFAADPNPASPYRDRMYCIWSDSRSGSARLYFIRSLDRGSTWTPAREILAPASGNEQQFQSAISVNARGDVAVVWFQTSPDGRSYREYASISTDGGASFMAPRQLSSADSFPQHAGNVVFAPSGYERLAGKAIGIYFVSGFERWPMGGDYTGLAADSDGRFHALWSDGRGPATQAWTTEFFAGTPAAEPPLREGDVSADVVLVFGAGAYDAATHQFSYPVRVKNISSHVIYGPLQARISAVQNPYFVVHHEARSFDEPRIYGATNGLHGVGAVFSYASALGDFASLQPGATTGAVTWRFSVPLMANPYLVVSISGYLPAELP